MWWSQWGRRALGVAAALLGLSWDPTALVSFGDEHLRLAGV